MSTSTLLVTSNPNLSSTEVLSDVIRPGVADLPIWPLSVEQYHAMAATGILTEDDPVELLEGLLVYKMTKKPPHSVVTQLVREALRQILPSGWYVASQEPLTLMDSEPEPDVMVVSGHIRQYLTRHPGPQDVALVVEVADSTLTSDRSSKKRIYARASVAVYWLINLPENQIEVYTNPSGEASNPSYQAYIHYGLEDEIPIQIANHEIGRLAVRELLP